MADFIIDDSEVEEFKRDSLMNYVFLTGFLLGVTLGVYIAC